MPKIGVVALISLLVFSVLPWPIVADEKAVNDTKITTSSSKGILK